MNNIIISNEYKNEIVNKISSLFSTPRGYLDKEILNKDINLIINRYNKKDIYKILNGKIIDNDLSQFSQMIMLELIEYI